MSDCASKCPKLSRRSVLVFGLSTLGLSTSCAILRGGAKHPVYEPSGALRQGSLLRIPLEELEALGAKGVLELRPGKPDPVLLVARDGDAWRVVTADCPHLGCTVDWEPPRRRWTCPCHGSEFEADGTLVEGPAKTGLASLTPVLDTGSDGRPMLTIDLGRLPRSE